MGSRGLSALGGSRAEPWPYFLYPLALRRAAPTMSQAPGGRAIGLVVAFVRRRAAPVVVAGLLAAMVSVWFAAGHLGINTDTALMFSADLPFRQRAVMLDRAFPQFQDLLVAVIDAREPEEADATAAALAGALAADGVHFRTVRRPDALPWLHREGMLFLKPDRLADLLDRTIDAQPFLGRLAADPSARGLFGAFSLLATGVEQGGVTLGPYQAALEGMQRAMAAAIAGRPEPLSWMRLLGGDLADLGSRYRFVLAQPVLAHGQLEAGGAATKALRDAAAQLEFVRSGAARVRITGSVALSDEEFATVARGAALGMVISVTLITLWLFLAVRSWRLILPILATLGLGLTLTLGFAAASIGTLNVVSVGFGILFIGIAVDFAIQFAVRYRDMRHRHDDPVLAMAETGRAVGAQILVAAAATSAGFLAFLPTDFRGVAELGLIAGVGMLIAFACTILFLPACIALLRPRGEPAEVGYRWGAWLDSAIRRRRHAVLAVFVVLGVAGALQIPRLRFDADPLHTKDPSTEAMRTLYDLMDSPVTNPFTITVLAANQADADALAQKLGGLPLVESVLSVNSFIPADQGQKLALIADAADILQIGLTPRAIAAPPSAAQIRAAAITALADIARVLPKRPGDQTLAAIAADLRALAGAADATLLATDRALTRFLPVQLDQLRTALQAEPVTLASIPPELARDWLLPDGRARVQVLPKHEARNSAGLAAFVAEVTAVAPEAGGSAVTIEATSATIVGAFRTAALAALAAITVLLGVALRRALDAALVLAPLLLSGLMTAIAMVVLKLPLNYANIIALPLLLGVGVSFNIYFVMNWRAGQIAVLGSPTARAILFSALTTGTAFGSLALSGHPGTASMGRLLITSLFCTLVASLVFIPALLASLRPRG